MPAKAKATTKGKKSTKKEAEKTPQQKYPPSVFDKTQVELENLSKILGCPILTYFNPPSGSIWSQDLYAILECLKHIGKVKKLALYVRSYGGQGMVSLRIINLIRSFADKLIILAPSECASAATIMALGCDEIYMGSLSSLSPVDSSLTHPLSPIDPHNNLVSVSQDELWRVLKLWKEATVNTFQSPNALSVPEAGESQLEFGFKSTKSEMSKNIEEKEQGKPGENPYIQLYHYIHPLVFGAIDRASSLSVKLCREMLSFHMTDEQQIEKISYSLNYDYPSHSYPITTKEAERIGLKVKQISPEIQDIMNHLQLLYSEMTDEVVVDYDQSMYYNHSIISTIETVGAQVYYQNDYDKFYRESEKRYILLNDNSAWHKVIWTDDKKKEFGTKKIHF
jgi:hypothetical protein